MAGRVRLRFAMGILHVSRISMFGTTVANMRLKLTFRNCTTGDGKLLPSRYGILSDCRSTSAIQGTLQMDGLDGKVKEHNSTSDRVIHRLYSAKSVDTVFVVVSSMKEAMTPARMCAAVATLDRLFYDQIRNYPWAYYDNPWMLCIQTFSNSEAMEIFQPLLLCSEFKSMCNLLLQFIPSFTDHELLTVTLSLLRLHVDPAEEVLVRLQAECMRRHESFDIEALDTFARIGNLLRRSGFFVNCAAAKLFQKRLDEWIYVPSNIGHLASALTNIAYFFTSDFVDELQCKLYQVLHRRSDIPVHCALELLETVARFSGNPRRELLSVLVEVPKLHVRTLRLWQVFRLVIFARMTGYEDPELHSLICQQVPRYSFKEGARCTDVVTLLNITDVCCIPIVSQEAFENLLMVHMDDLDTILLKQFGKSNILQRTSNPKLVEHFGRCVVRKLPDMIDSISCLLSAVNALSNAKYKLDSLDSILCSKIIQNLKGQLGRQPHHMALLSRYLVRILQWNRHQKEISEFLNVFTALAPHMTVGELIAIGTKLPYLRMQPFVHLSTVSKYNMEFMYSVLTRALFEKITEFQSVKEVNIASRTIFGNIPPSFKATVIPDVEHLYKKLCSTINIEDVGSTAMQLKNLKLYIPDVLERLEELLVTSISKVPLASTLKAVDAFAMLNFLPKRVEQLEQVLTEVAEMHIDSQEHVGDILTLVSSMVMLQMYPENVINRIFSLKFLKWFDVFLDVKGSERYRGPLEKLMLQLNLGVVLLCPHLGIPWFHSHLHQMNKFIQWDNPPRVIEQIDSTALFEYEALVHKSLVDTLGNENRVKNGPLYTPYGHQYDFECILDKNNKPLPVGECGYQRIAIIMNMPSHFCSNNHHVIGPIRNQVVQMEILGYRVVQIPYYELKSLMMSDDRDRHKYFSAKIFGPKESRQSFVGQLNQ